MNETRILIVENDSALRHKLYKAVLDVELFSDCAADAAEAIDYLSRREYGIVLLDLGIAGGAEAVLTALQKKPSSEPPIILAIAETHGASGLDAEVVQVVVRRPVRVRDVAELIRSCTEAQSRRRRVKFTPGEARDQR